jgi:hypothetical protein
MSLIYQDALHEDANIAQLFEALGLRDVPAPRLDRNAKSKQPAIKIYSSDEEELPSQADITSPPVSLRFPSDKEPYIKFTDADRQATRQKMFKKRSSVKSTDESTDEYPDSETERSIAAVDLQSLESLYPCTFKLNILNIT